MSLYIIHPHCGAREWLLPGQSRPDCKACDQLREAARHAVRMRWGGNRRVVIGPNGWELSDGRGGGA